MIDWAVKRLFGKGNEIFLKSLLDAILEGEQKTDSLITYLDKEHTGETFEDRTSIFDLLARDSKQQNFLIESQICYQEFFMKRVVFYLSKFVSTEGKKGEWDFNFNPTTAVCITDFDYPEGKDYPNDTRDIKRFGLFDKQTLDPILEDCSIIIVDLKNFNKSEDELETMLDKWLYLFKHMSNIKKMPVIYNEPIFKQFLKNAEFMNLSKEDREKYTCEHKRSRDLFSKIKTAEKEAENKIKIKIVRKLLLNPRLTFKDIAKATSLSLSMVKKISMEEVCV